MANKKPIVIEGGGLAEIGSADILQHSNMSITAELTIPDIPSTTPNSIRVDSANQILYANFGGSEVAIGGAGSAYIGAPVANEAALPVTAQDGEIRVTLDTNNVYVYDQVTSSWTMKAGLIKEPALENNINSLAVTGDFIGQLIISSDTYKVFAWNGSSWTRTSSAYIVKDIAGVEQAGVYEIYGKILPSSYVTGTGASFVLPIGSGSILAVTPYVELSGPFVADDYLVNTHYYIDIPTNTVYIKVVVGSYDVGNGVLRIAELDPASSYGGIFAGNNINSIGLRALVQ